MLFYFQAVGDVQLFVDIGGQQAAGVFASHAQPPAFRSPSARASRPRARANRDITVPTGTPVTAPISLYDSPSSSRSTIASRNSAGNSSIARRSASRSTFSITTASGLGAVDS